MMLIVPIKFHESASVISRFIKRDIHENDRFVPINNSPEPVIYNVHFRLRFHMCVKTRLILANV
jgi:hypothetical protein